MNNSIPKALGPYSAYRTFGNMVYLSGQLGINPENNELEENIESQTKQALVNISNILKLENLDMNNIVKTTILLSNIEDFNKVNEIYATFFKEPYPARSAFAVKDLPKKALVEIEVIAIKQ